MKEICEYKLLVANDAYNFSLEVNKYINDGWQPYEGPSVAKYSYNTIYTQAVVKYKE